MKEVFDGRKEILGKVFINFVLSDCRRFSMILIRM